MPAIAAIPLFSVSLGALGTITVTVGTVAMVGLAAGSVVYSQMQARKMEKQARAAMLANQGMTLTNRDPAAQRRVIYGETRVGGSIVFLHTTGTRNKFLHLIITLAGHEVESIGDIYFDDMLVPILNPGDESELDEEDEPIYEVGDAIAGSSFTGKARILKHLGTEDQEADATLMDEVPSKWNSTHRLRGIAYIYVRLSYDAETFSGLPNISAVVKGKKLYDPRSSSTAWSENPALCVRDYLTNADYGLGAAVDEIDDASFISKANICDEAVPLSIGGTEKRYTCDGAFERSMTPSNLLENLLSTFAASLIYTGGTWSLAGAAYEAPVVDFSWGDMRGDIAIQTADSRRDSCNAVKGTYISPLNKWQPADYPPVKNATYLTEDANERSWREADYPLTKSASMAQRLAKIELERARQDITVKLPLKLQGLKVKAGDNITLTLDRYGWDAKPFEVMSWRFITQGGGFSEDDSAPILGIEMEVRETAEEVWDWDDAEEQAVDPAANTDLPDWRSVAAPRSLGVASTATVQGDGTLVASITASWLEPLDNFVVTGGTIEVEYKKAADTEWTPSSIVAGSQLISVIVPVEIGFTYRVRVRSVNNLGATSAWVVSAEVVAAGDTTAPGVPTSPAVSGIYKGIRISWTNPTDSDLAYIDIYEHTAATPAPDGATIPYGRTYGSEFVRVGLGIGDERWYWVRAVDASGNKSAWVGGLNTIALAVGNAEITSTQISDDAITTPKLAANSITADKVGTNEIIAAAANIGDAVITGAKIQDLAVGTLKLADQAVTIPVNAYTAGTISVGANTWVTIQSATIISSGAPIMVMGTCVLATTASPTFAIGNIGIRILRGATQISESRVVGMIADQPGAGTHTYNLQVLGISSGACQATFRSLLLLETKK